MIIPCWMLRMTGKKVCTWTSTEENRLTNNFYGQISKNLKCDKTHLKWLYWITLCCLCLTLAINTKLKIIVWVPVGEHKITMAHLPDALVSSGQSMNHPEMSESLYLLLSTLRVLEERLKSTCWWRKKNILLNIHLPRPVLGVDTPSSWLISYFRNSTILRRRTNSQGLFITVLRYILILRTQLCILYHILWVSGEKKAPATGENTPVATTDVRKLLIKIQKCWWGMNSLPCLLKKVNFWI